MAKRSRTASTRQGAARAAARGDGKDGQQEPPGRDAHRHPFHDLADILFGPSALLDRRHPFGRVAALLLLHSLEWQSAALEAYRRALAAGAFDVPVEDHVRTMARGLMTAYLELVKSSPERRERLVAEHSELVKALADAIADLRERLAEPPPDRRPPRP